MWPPGLKTQECEGSVYFQLSLWIWLHMSISSILVIERYRKCSAISSIQRFSKDELRFAKMLSQGQLTEAEDWKIDCSKTKHGPSESLVALAKWIKVIFKMKSIEPLGTISLIFLFRHAFGMQVQVQEKEDEKVPSRSLSVTFLDLPE